MTRRVIFLLSNTVLCGTSFFVSLFGGASSFVGLLALIAWFLGFFVFAKSKLLLGIALLVGLLSTWVPLIECYHSLYNALVVRQITSSQSDLFWAGIMALSVSAILVSVGAIIVRDVGVPNFRKLSARA